MISSSWTPSQQGSLNNLEYKIAEFIISIKLLTKFDKLLLLRYGMINVIFFHTLTLSPMGVGHMPPPDFFAIAEYGVWL